MIYFFLLQRCRPMRALASPHDSPLREPSWREFGHLEAAVEGASQKRRETIGTDRAVQACFVGISLPHSGISLPH